MPTEPVQADSWTAQHSPEIGIPDNLNTVPIKRLLAFNWLGNRSVRVHSFDIRDLNGLALNRFKTAQIRVRIGYGSGSDAVEAF